MHCHALLICLLILPRHTQIHNDVLYLVMSVIVCFPIGSLPGSTGRPPSISFSTPRSGSGTSNRSDTSSTPESVISVEDPGFVIAGMTSSTV